MFTKQFQIKYELTRGTLIAMKNLIIFCQLNLNQLSRERVAPLRNPFGFWYKEQNQQKTLRVRSKTSFAKAMETCRPVCIIFYARVWIKMNRRDKQDQNSSRRRRRLMIARSLYRFEYQWFLKILFCTAFVLIYSNGNSSREGKCYN